MRGVIVIDHKTQIPVGDWWFDDLLRHGGTATRTRTNGPGESWIVQQNGADKPVLLVVNSNSEASDTLATMRKE